MSKQHHWRARILSRISRRLRRKTIEINGAPYLNRYYLGSIRGHQFWLHQFLTADRERHLHCHPWEAWSVVLSGGYLEEIQQRGRLRDNWDWELHQRRREAFPLGRPAFISIGHRHRIALVRPNTWTLMWVKPGRYPHWNFYDSATGDITGTNPASPEDWWKDCDRGGES